jgi:hypothetical protein
VHAEAVGEVVVVTPLAANVAAWKCNTWDYLTKLSQLESAKKFCFIAEIFH